MNLSTSMRQRRRAWVLPLLVTFVLSLSLASCGTRLSEGEARSQLAGAYSGTGQAGVTGSAAGRVGSGTAGTVGEVGAGGSGDSVARGNSGNSLSGGSGSDAGGSGGTGSSGDGGAASGAPIVIGMTGTFSGIVGSVLGRARDSYAAWARWVNDNGGINGHPVTLLIADNHGSASEDMANAKRFVEQEGAIALVNYMTTTGTEESTEEYARSKNIPIVGGEPVEDIWWNSPNMFSTGGWATTMVWGYANAMKDAGKTKVGSLYCAESGSCKLQADTFRKEAAGMGLDVVYEAQVSIAQPDYTAQCVEARNRGVEAIIMIVDGASGNRIAQSCDRQDYKPLLVYPNPTPTFPSYVEGSVGVNASFPWFLQSGSPALNEYGSAMKRYGSSVQHSYTSLGWVNGKLLEAALSKGVSSTPTSEDIFKGLWALKNETLGGLTPSLTFRKGRPQEEPRCVWSITASNEKWTAPQGIKPNMCR